MIFCQEQILFRQQVATRVALILVFFFSETFAWKIIKPFFILFYYQRMQGGQCNILFV